MKKQSLSGRILFVGQCYYNNWYLSRELRKRGWRADVVNWDESPENQMYYHGEDIRFSCKTLLGCVKQVWFYLLCFFKYDVFHFANMEGLRFGVGIPFLLEKIGLKGWDIKLLKLFGKKIVYTNNGCHDGVSQTAFSQWKPYNVCSICVWKDHPEVCSDERNLAWGKFRNDLADYQCTLGGNRADYNDDPRVHEAPWAYSLDKNFWNPDLIVPSNYILPFPASTVKLYHSVGNFDSRSQGKNAQTIKSTHIYLELVERYKKESLDVEMIFFKDVPNKKLRYYQAQADIFLDMLTFGFFGANVREAMMMGKPAVCFLRPEWLESMRKEIPEFVDELPVVSATPDTVYEIVRDLIVNREKRLEIGRRSRIFAEKWFASDVAAIEAERVYLSLLKK